MKQSRHRLAFCSLPLEFRVRCYLVGCPEEDGDIVGGVITHFNDGFDRMSSFQQAFHSAGIVSEPWLVLPRQIDDCGIVPAVISQTATLDGYAVRLRFKAADQG